MNLCGWFGAQALVPEDRHEMIERLALGPRFVVDRFSGPSEVMVMEGI
jgi:hypothetical protein